MLNRGGGAISIREGGLHKKPNAIMHDPLGSKHIVATDFNPLQIAQDKADVSSRTH